MLRHHVKAKPETKQELIDFCNPSLVEGVIEFGESKVEMKQMTVV